MRAEDAYKWLYHATLGGEHAVRDDVGPRLWLDGEWSELGEPVAGEPPVVELRPDGHLIRVNLRPYKAAGGDREALLQAFVASARAFHADRSEFVREWIALREVLANGPVGEITGGAWHAIDAEASEAGYPAIEHSESYLAACRPAYRVMLADVWERASG